MTSVIAARWAPANVRVACATDLPAIRDMLFRCSPAALRDRTHGGVRPEPLVSAVRLNVLEARGVVLVAVRGRLVVGCLELVRSASAPTVDLAVLVEDAWQGRGIGGSLLCAARPLVRSLGVDAVTFSVEAANTRARRLMTGFLALDPATRVEGEWHDGVFEVTWRRASTS